MSGLYRVARPYSAQFGERRLGPWEKDDAVELEYEVAEWVERDSPGTLKHAGAVADDEVAARQKPASANRQHRGGANRGK